MLNSIPNETRHLNVAVAALAVSIVLAFGTLAHAVAMLAPAV